MAQDNDANEQALIAAKEMMSKWSLAMIHINNSISCVKGTAPKSQVDSFMQAVSNVVGPFYFELILPFRDHFPGLSIPELDLEFQNRGWKKPVIGEEDKSDIL
jgi:hypothetical protein